MVLMRMLSATGNPQAKNLFKIVAYLHKIEGAELEVVDRESVCELLPNFGQGII
jgi:hypothetical protein